MTLTTEDAIKRALELTDAVPEPLRATAFGAVLEHLLGGQQSQTGVVQPKTETLALQLPTNLVEFLAMQEPKTHTDRVLLIAYYSYKKGDELGVTVKEIEEGYRQVRQQRPKNLSDVIATCVKQGRMIESSERKSGAKAWLPTLTGERHVEAEKPTRK